MAMLAGCICDEDRFGRPNLFHPGHISEQRARMERFDPYPQVGFGPTVEGDRPRGAEIPRPPIEKVAGYENYKQYFYGVNGRK